MSQTEEKILYEAFCEKCSKTIEIAEIPKKDLEGAGPDLAAQFLRCPDCHKFQDFAYFQIGTRPYKGNLKPGHRSLKKENYGIWVEN